MRTAKIYIFLLALRPLDLRVHLSFRSSADLQVYCVTIKCSTYLQVRHLSRAKGSVAQNLF